MASRQPVRCYLCHELGHIQRWCPRIQCHRCKRYGHTASFCRNLAASRSCEAKPQRGLPGRSSENQSDNVFLPQSSRMSTGTSIVTSFFQQHPNFHRQAHLLYQCRPVSLSSCSSQDSSEPSSPGPPVVCKVKCSDIRADETVKRVSETIYRLMKDDEEPFCILVNKRFEHFQEDKTAGLLYIPKEKEDLQRGDWDILILHPVYGYIHIEVKAFGDAQDHLDDGEKMKCLIDRLKDAVENLRKGQRALECLQPQGQQVNIINALALPNITRQYLRQALQFCPALREALAGCLFPGAERSPETTVDAFCLCADDLPPKDGTVDEHDPHVRQSVKRWWSKITPNRDTTVRLRTDIFKCVLASFCHSEVVKNFSEVVQDTAEKYRGLILHEQQQQVVECTEQNVFITGPPGCGKTIILAQKTVSWLRENLTVFIVYQHGMTTNQPAAETLLNFIERIGLSSCSSTLEEEFPLLHKKCVSHMTDIDEFLNEIHDITRDPTLGKQPKSSKLKAEDHMFREVVVPANSLEAFFRPSALPETIKEEQTESTENGARICFVFDELTQRTVKGKTIELISQIRKRYPAARIWCAGPIPTHCPADDFHPKELLYGYRCTPQTQRLLQALEPFCYNEERSMFRYVTSSTRVPRTPEASQCEEQNVLPGDGPDPFFVSHAGHGNREITDCRRCADNLVRYLRDTLQIKRDDAPEDGIHARDVLIVVTGTVLYNNMHSLMYEEFYRHLTKELTEFGINVYMISDNFDLAKPGMSVMHSRAVAGMEKKVVIFLPCMQQQAKQLTYAQAVKTQPVPKVKTHPNPRRVVQSQNTSETDAYQTSAVQSSPSPDQETVHPESRDQGHPPSAPGSVFVEDNTQRHIEEKLQRCPHITLDQKQKLARLGVLNLHWLWHSVSRSLAHNVIFHF